MSADSSFLHWIYESFEDYVWLRISNYLNLFVVPYTVNYEVNKLLELQRTMPKSSRNAIKLATIELYDSPHRDKHIEALLARIAGENGTKATVNFGIYQVVQMALRFVRDGYEVPAKELLNDVKRELGKAFVRACTKENISPIPFLAVSNIK